MSHVVEVIVDEEGRLRLPVETLRALGLAPGMTLVVEEAPGGDACLSVRTGEPTLVEKGGVLVVQGELTGEWSDVVRSERDRRVDRLVQQVNS
jgi:bifunctional DNA-binding transcriptional regulator/antitoxin component of YhaV-PrlF toxin-antitoxin module